MDNFSIVIKFLGDELEPKEISNALGVESDWSATKGTVIEFDMPGGRKIEREMSTGFWQIMAGCNKADEIPIATKQLIERMHVPSQVIAKIAEQFDGQIIFTNDAEIPDTKLQLSASLSATIAERKLQVYINEFS